MKKILRLLTILVGWLSYSQSNAQCQPLFVYSTSGNGVYVFVDSTSKYYNTDNWSFGDGNSTSNTSGQVSHTYTRPGKYTVCRIVWDSINACRDTFCLNITYTVSCKALFSYKVSGDTVTFQNTSTNAAWYTWNFGDNKTSSVQNPTHIYKSASTYVACLTIYDSTRTCSDKYCLTLTTSGSSGCDASFTIKQNNTSAVFNAKTITPSVIYTWDYGDGDTGSTSSSTHVYKVPGGNTVYTYSACLYTYNPITKCSDSSCKTITVFQDTCVASFTTTISGLVVAYKNTSQSGVYSQYVWNFGDGDTSHATQSSHTYKKPGTYYPCLTVSDTILKCTSTYCDTVVVDTSKTSKCKAEFKVAVDTSQKFKLFLINTSSNKSSHTYYWDFGDGGRSTYRNPSHKYRSFGKYNVCLVVTDNVLNCTSTFCDSLGLDSSGRLLKADGFDLEVIDDLVSVPKIADLAYNIYPNPFSSQFIVELKEVFGGDAFVEVFNLQGSSVAAYQLNNDAKASINLSEEVDGLYLIRIFDGKNYAQAKTLKMSK